MVLSVNRDLFIINCCSVDGCEKPPVRKGMCNAHYLKAWRYGDPKSGGICRGQAVQFLLDHIEHIDENCLIWPFYRTPRGYGDVNFPNIEGQAHRVMCFLAHGEPPPEHVAAHSCGNGHLGCINPIHLSWKTQRQNIHDKAAHGTQPWGDQIHFARLNLEQAKRAKYGNEKSRELAKEFGVSVAAIDNIRANRTWKGL